MNNYEEGINSMWEEVESKKPCEPHRQTDQEKWEELKKEFYGKKCSAQTEWGIICFNQDSMKEIQGGENLNYDEYLDIMKESGNKVRHYNAAKSNDK